jgi:hypothetical protein
MKIIRPVTVTDSVLDASNITENDFPQWAVGTTYSTGDKVIVLSTHRIYESVISSNVGNNPTTDDGTKWLNIGATNRWRAFDKTITDQATNTTSITYSFDPQSLVNSIAFFNLEGTSVGVTVTDAVDGEVYDETVSLVDNGAVENWWSYFFEPIVRKTEIVLFDLPNYVSAILDVSINAPTGDTAKVGQIVFGNQKTLGLTTYGTTVGIQDYSTKDTDAFGNVIITERRFAQTVEYDVKLITSTVRDVQKTLAGFRATPLVYSGTDTGEFGDLVYGYYRNFGINISTPSLSDATIEVEGLV